MIETPEPISEETEQRPVRKWLPRFSLLNLHLRTSERRLVLALIDVLLLYASLIVAVRVRTAWLDPPGAVFANWRWFVTLGIVWWLVSNVLESYELPRTASAPHSILSASSAVAVTVALYQWIPVYSPPLQSRGLVFLFGAMAMASVSLWRGIYAVLFVQPNFQQCALVLGAGQSGHALAEALQSVPEAGNPYYGTGYKLIGFVDDDPERRAQGDVEGIPVLGSSEDLVRLVRALNADEVVVAVTHRHLMSQAAFDAVLVCREMGIAVSTMPALYERLFGRVPVDHVGRDLGAVLPLEGGATDRVFMMVKRGMDLAGGLVGLVFVAVVSVFVWIANLILCPGPLFYTQTRVGRGGCWFRVYKFRTMVPDAERDGPQWAKHADQRITPVGRLLRRSRLDELPQFLNVLLGQMSLVGPRPERPEFVDALAEQIPFYRARHAVRPGVTGWAQVRYGYGDSVDTSRIKLEYDLYYVRHAGFNLDLLILLKTAAVMFRLQGK